MSKRNDSSNIFLWLLGIGLLGGAGFLIYKKVSENRQSKNYVVNNTPEPEPTTDNTAQSQTLKERGVQLLKDTANTGVNRAIDSLFNRMFN